MAQEGPIASSTVAAGAVGTTQLANDAVTYAKIQNVSATDKVLGRSTAGAGDVEEIPCTAAGRAMIAAADAAAQAALIGVVALTHRYQSAVVWYRENVVINLTADPLVRAGTAASFAATWPAPRNGSIVAITWRLTAPITVGSLTLDPVIAGVPQGQEPGSDSVTRPSGGTVTYSAGSIPYNAGDAVGIVITTDALLVPAATNDIEVWIQVEEAA